MFVAYYLPINIHKQEKLAVPYMIIRIALTFRHWCFDYLKTKSAIVIKKSVNIGRNFEGKVTRSPEITHRSQHPNHESGRYSYRVASFFQHSGVASHQLRFKRTFIIRMIEAKLMMTLRTLSLSVDSV